MLFNIYTFIGSILFAFFAKDLHANDINYTDAMTATENSAPLLVKYPKPVNDSDARHHYYLSLLELALEKTLDRYGPYTIRMVEHANTAKRTHESFDRGDLSISVISTTVELESQARAVRIPLTKGLIGYRVFLIKRSSQPTFSGIENTKELQKLLASQPHYWTDYTILKENGFRTTGLLNYETNFAALTMGRVDYFPRSIIEIEDELNSRPPDELSIETRHIMKYPAAIYFFVGKNNLELEQRLTAGLKAAQADGSFDSVFDKQFIESKALERLQIPNRHIHMLSNSTLPKETPLLDKHLWLSYEELLEKLQETSSSLNHPH